MRRLHVLVTIGLGLGITACGQSPMLMGGGFPATYDAFGKSKTPTPSKYGGYGAIIDSSTPRLVYDEAGFSTKALPDRVDLRSACPPIRNQGLVGACTGFAVAAFREIATQIETGRSVTLSPRFIYYVERQMMDRSKKWNVKCLENDTGAPTVFGMEVLQSVGAVEEDASPFASLDTMRAWGKLTLEGRNQAIKNFVSAPPSPSAFGEARQNRMTGGYRGLKTLSNVKHSLKSGSPVVLSMQVYDSFESDVVSRTGKMPLPNPKKEKLQGGHAILVVGYDNREGHLIVRNSWGPGWGDKGYFYMPYEFVKAGFAYNAMSDK